MKILVFNLNSNPESKAGFSLLEIMVSFSIFAFVMVGVFWTLISAQRLGESARNRMNALQQARASMEQVLSSGYSSAALAPGSHAVSRGGLSGEYVVVEPVPDGRKRVVMTYRYPSFGREAAVELQMEVSHALH